MLLVLSIFFLSQMHVIFLSKIGRKGNGIKTFLPAKENHVVVNSAASTLEYI